MKSIGQRKTNKLEIVLFILPCLILVGVIFYTPFILSMFYSLTQWNGIAKEPVFIGLRNFIRLFTGDSGFVSSIIFTSKYAFFYIISSNVIALVLAVLLVKKLLTANILRAVFFVPYIMSMIIVGFIWRFIFSQGFNSLSAITGWGIFDMSWLGDPGLAFVSVVMVAVWQSLGFYMVIYIAGLQALPEDVLEAAVVDGASAPRKFFSITLPLLGPSITTCLFLSLTNSIKVFDIILALTAGGPGGSTYSVTYDIYREAFQNNNYGYGAAKSLVLFIIVAGITVIIMKGFRSREVEL